MVERLPSLPPMQQVIDALTDAYGETAEVTYNTDGTTCLILAEGSAHSDAVYVAIVQIDLETMKVRTREIAVEEADISSVLI